MMKKYIAIFAAGLISYWIIGGIIIFTTGHSGAEHIALFLETIIG